ncbi:type VI secretion system lipoprotein TssJ [Lysobacter sp. F60174L2]|uniref:type VI secretion system lipoprotein TssJ n=1 Tax=Lysobacter sp. F60174L2 TaxID=3459295 RepID=UPI00403D6576
MDGLPTLQSPHARLPGRRWLAALLPVLLVASGCSSQGGLREAFDKSLQAVGLRDAGAQAQQVPLRLYAGDNLNAGDGKRPLSLVVRVYQLRSIERFEAAPFDVFLDQQREHDVLGDDLLGVTEILLAPGQRHEVLERLPAGGGHVGVVALFRQPARSRWRFSFDADEATGDGITVGLHACAMTTPSLALETRLASPSHSLASSNCAPPQG